MRRAAVAAVLLVAGLAGCGGGSDDERAAPARPGPPKLVADRPDLPVEAFNRRAAASDESWARSPLLAAAEFLRLDLATARTVTVLARAGPEGGGPTVVDVTLDGLLDDSIRALRYVLTFTPQAGGKWRLVSARWSQRCQRGRGHQSFTAAACV